MFLPGRGDTVRKFSAANIICRYNTGVMRVLVDSDRLSREHVVVFGPIHCMAQYATYSFVYHAN